MIFAVACRVISALIVGFPVRIGLAAQGHCIMKVHLDPSRIPDGRRSLATLFDSGIVAESDGATIYRIGGAGSYPHGDVIDRIRLGIGTDGDGPDIRHACGTNVVAGSGLGANGNTFSSSRFCLMTDGNGAFAIIPIVPGIGFIT